MTNERGTGCLLIDDPLCGTGTMEPTAGALSRMGVRVGEFRWNGAGRLYPALQRAYQQIRKDGDTNGIVALGTGCDCALALACQLPADRLVLIDPVTCRDSGDTARQLRRIRGFARRNAAFCVADVLIVPGPPVGADAVSRFRHDLAGKRVTLLRPAEELWSNRKEVLNLGIFHFLRDGVLPKSLAENSEMCIIYR